MKKLLIIYVLLSISICSLYSQNKIIKGKVISEDLETLPYTLIFINDTVKVGRTDLNGFFRIDIPISVDKILFMNVGFEQATIDLLDTNDEIEVVMMFSVIYDFKTLKKINRLRLKRFKKLPELHKKAFEKNIFKTESAFYNYEFKPIYEKYKKVN